MPDKILTDYNELATIIDKAVYKAVTSTFNHLSTANQAPETTANLLTIDEVCIMLNFKRGYVYELAMKGKIPCYRVGRSLRFSKTELEQWIKAGRPDVMQMGYDAMTANHFVNPKNK